VLGMICFAALMRNGWGTVRVIDLGRQAWTFRQVGNGEWHPASVPGCVLTDLRKNGLVGDPFLRTNEKTLQWIGERDWEYRTSFALQAADLESERLELVFQGLDTLADVFLNSRPVLEADNFYRQWVVDVHPYAMAGENELRVVFHATRPYIEKRKKQALWKPPEDFAFIRKPPYHYGWDWGPVFLTAGIWRPAFLRLGNGPSIENIQVVTDGLDDRSARLRLLCQVKAAMPVKATLEAEIKEAGVKAVRELNLKKGSHKVEVPLEVKNPRRWWCAGLGEPFLYTAGLALRVAGGPPDLKEQRFGLRTLKVVQAPDGKGSSFYVELNGRPVFMKGANTIPQSMFPSEVTASDYEFLIRQVQAAHMNMLRVWGGGIYEDDLFYDLCDRAGILVWQDFMFACSMYPDDPGFLENVRQEAVDNVTRLRNHPCLALWCGNNEVAIGWKDWNWPQLMGLEHRDRIWQAYQKVFNQILPEVVAGLDPGRFYWPSSPKQGWGYPVNTDGDVHYWGVWHGQLPFEAFLKPENIGRFMSEYGFQGMPEMNSLLRFAWPEDLDLSSEVMKIHQKHRLGYPVIDKYLKWYYRWPKDFEAYSYVSQVLQAYGISMAIEAHRRAMPFCMGTLYWQLNDCYPVTSWSSLDVYGAWKALHYRVRRAFGEVLVSPVVEDGRARVYVVSDLRDPLAGRMTLELLDFKGRPAWEKSLNVKIPPNRSSRLFDISLSDLLQGRDKEGHVLRVRLVAGERKAENLLYFVTPKDLKLEEPAVRANMAKEGQGWRVDLQTDTLAKDVFLSVPGAAMTWSDNYFDLLPGETKSVTFRGSLPPGMPAPALKIYSLVDSY
jgi:beta-mannosidase